MIEIWFTVGGQRAIAPLTLPGVPRPGEIVHLPRNGPIDPGVYRVVRVEWRADVFPSGVWVHVEPTVSD